MFSAVFVLQHVQLNENMCRNALFSIRFRLQQKVICFVDKSALRFFTFCVSAYVYKLHYCISIIITLIFFKFSCHVK